MLSSARYGLPPPPVPRIQAPIASDSISAAETGRRVIGSVCYPPAIAMQTGRLTMRVLLTAALAVLVAASQGQTFERAGDRKILVFAGRQEVPTIDPSVKYDWAIRMAQQSLYDALVKYVGNPPEIVPWLAEKWESSPDAKTWTFHLVKTTRFHNGDPVTAEAVRFSFARTLKLNQGPAWTLAEFLKEDDIKVLNEHTIQFTLTQPYSPFLSWLPWWYVMNTKQGPTKDSNLRKAVCYAFDYDALIKIYNGHAVLQTSPFPNATRGYVPVSGIYRQDLAKAKEFLAKSTSPNGGVELEYVYVQGLEEERKMGLVLIDNLQKLNIAVKMVPLIWPNMVARGAKVETSPDMMAVFTTPLSSDPDAVAYQYHKGSFGKYYASSFYSNDAVSSLIDRARTIAKWEERAPIYADIQRP